MTTKTPEELAEEYTKDWWGNLPEAEGMRKSARDNFLAGYKTAQEHAHAALEEAKVKLDAVFQWISVKDRLPEDSDDLSIMLVWRNSEHDYDTVRWRYQQGWDCVIQDRASITHWMPLPPSPKEKA